MIVMSGIGLSGVTVSLIRVITKLTLEPQGTQKVPLSIMTLSSAIYFFVSAGFVAICSITFLFVLRSSFVKYYMTMTTSETKDDLLPINSERQPVSLLVVFGKIWNMCLNVSFVFFVTLTVFPGLSATIETHYPQTFMKDWLSILMVVVCNIFDFIGRSLPRFLVVFNTRTIGVPVLIRSIFLPLFILCIYPRVITHDVFPLLFMALFSISGGYLGSLSMMLAPSLVRPHEKESSGMLMNMFLLLGILIGSNFGLLVGKVVGL
jgi:equilibrative nucleoside transporter 1/2/3